MIGFEEAITSNRGFLGGRVVGWVFVAKSFGPYLIKVVLKSPSSFGEEGYVSSIGFLDSKTTKEFHGSHSDPIL